MIGIFVGTTAVGIYRIAVSLSTAAASLLNGISKVVFPYFTSAEAEGKDSIKELNKALKYGYLFQFQQCLELFFQQKE
jgi:O-antigen/teichoic acid export membrane protein